MLILQIKNLSAGYKDLPVLKNVSLNLEEGTLAVLMGPNGAGKSTLLRSIFALTDMTSGDIFFENEKITKIPASELLSKGVAFVSQGRVNFSTLNVRDNLLLGAHHLKDKAELEKRLQEVYAQFPILKEKQRDYAFALSGGQQQMLAIGRALMNKPKLLLMDEPSLGLAPKLVKEVFQKIVEIRDRFQTTILIVEHNLKSLLDIADYGYVLVQGEIVVEDSCKALKQSDIMKKVFVGGLE